MGDTEGRDGEAVPWDPVSFLFKTVTYIANGGSTKLFGIIGIENSFDHFLTNNTVIPLLVV